MGEPSPKSVIATRRKRNPDGTFVKGPVEKYAMPAHGDNTRFADHIQGDPWIANPHDNWAAAAPPGITPVAPGVYHANIFRMISQVPNQVFRNLDEALKANRISAKAMLNDGAIIAPLMQRILHLVSCNDGLVPEDENDDEQIAACQTLWNIVQETKDWMEFKRTLAEAIWYGKCANICNYRWEYIAGHRRMVCRGFTPIIGDKLVFRTNGQMGYIVHMPTGMRDVVVTDVGRAELFNDDDREAIVHHKYFIQDVAYDDGQLAIGQEGFGYRHFLYYLWWLKQSILEWSMLGLQIFGSGGLRIGYFELGNDDSKNAVATAMTESNGTNIILFPRSPGTEKDGAGLEVVSPNGMGLEWFKNFLSDYFGRQIEQLILGYDYTERRSDLYAFLKYDADKLSETITQQYVRVLQKYNLPGYRHKIRYKIHVPHYDPSLILQASQRIFEMGGEVSQSEVLQLCGLTVSHSGKKILKKTEEQFLGGVAGMGPANPNKSVAAPDIELGDLSRNLETKTSNESTAPKKNDKQGAVA